MNFTAAVACNDRWASFDPDNEKSAQRYNDAWSWPGAADYNLRQLSLNQWVSGRDVDIDDPACLTQS
jgi:hypothetical protein